MTIEQKKIATINWVMHLDEVDILDLIEKLLRRTIKKNTWRRYRQSENKTRSNLEA